MASNSANLWNSSVRRVTQGREPAANPGGKPYSTCGCQLVFALDKVPGDGLEALGAAAVRLQGREGFVDQVGGVALALLDAEYGRPSRLFGGQVLACRFAQVSRIDRHVEHVVHDLKSQPGLAAECVERGDIRC